jgi:two-component system sensor histidine kinase UhpB
MGVLAVSLRLQLVLLTTFVLLVSLIIGGVLTYGQARGKVQTEIRAAMAVGTRLARNAIDDAAMSAEPERRLRRMVSEFDGDRHLRASWVDPEGLPVASSTLAAARDAAPGWLYRMLAGRPEIARLALPAPLLERGNIVLETDAHNEIAEAWDDIELTLAIVGIFCGLVLVLTYVTLGFVLRPLRHLSNAFAQIGGGRYAGHVAETGPLELSRLCHGFNQMLDRLSAMETENLRLQEQLAAVQDEERADLARDLHDEVGPFLFAVGVDAAMIKRLAETGVRAEIAARSDAIRDATEHMQKHIRAMLGRLRPGVLLDVGLRPALANLIIFWTARQPGLHLEISFPDEEIGPPADEVIYRIIQESVSNAVRHGRPGKVEIKVARDGGDLLVTVADDGQGFQPPGHRPGYGLAGMEERVRALGGTLALRTRPTGGVTVSARLPEHGVAQAPEPSNVASFA